MSLREYWNTLYEFDWYYTYSDARQVFEAGRVGMARLIELAKESTAHRELLDGFRAHVFSGKPWNTPKVPMPEQPQ